MNKHTPGPWELLAEPECTLVIAAMEPRIGDKWFGIALIPHGDDAHEIAWEIKQANARLVSSAPDLLAALQAVLDADPTGVDDPDEDAYNRAQVMAWAAIRKARGTP